MQISHSCKDVRRPHPDISPPVRTTRRPRQILSKPKHQQSLIHHASLQDVAAPADLQTSQEHADQAHGEKSLCPFGGHNSPLVQPDSPAVSLPIESEPQRLSVSLPPREYLAFKDEPYKIDLRLDRITIDDIFEVDEEYEADMERKGLMLDTRPAEMMLPSVPGCEAAQKEVLALTVSVLTKVFPDRFQLQGTVLSNVATGEVFDVADTCTNPMDTVARLVQEDIAVMQKIDGRLIMSCGAVVSPLGWSGSQKVGLDLAGIHEPVPHFNDGGALRYVSKIFEKGLKAEVPLSRANWFIMHTSEHSLFSDAEHIPEAPEEGPITVDNAGERLFLRCERQVATRLPECGGVMFSFRTYLRPLKVLEKRTEVMQCLLAAFMALPEEVVAYRKAWHDMSTRDVAIQYLQKIANQQ